MAAPDPSTSRRPAPSLYTKRCARPGTCPSRRANRDDPMRRRSFLAAISLATLPKVAAAQSSRRPFRVGWVFVGSQAAAAPYLEPLRAGFAEHGYVEGRDFVLEERYGDEDPDRLSGMVE